MTAPLKITLTAPIEFEGQAVASFTIRPPIDEDFEAARRAVNVSRRIRGLRFIARLVDVSQRTFEEIERRDEAAARAVWAFVREHTGW